MKTNSIIPKRLLGRTGFEVSVLGLGGHTYPIGKSSDCFCSFEDRVRLIRHLVSAGVNYFDSTWTKEVKLLADSMRCINFDENAYVSLQYVDAISDLNWRNRLRGEVEKRLTIMDYTYAPLFLMGLGNENVPYNELTAACEAMMRLKEEGLVQNIGVSCHRLDLFPLISRAIQETNVLDYIMIRFNWKYRQANEELFAIAEDKDVGIVVMKIFCWDCGPSQWTRNISIFEPVRDEDRTSDRQSLSPAQRNLLWSIQNSPCHVIVPSINTMWEANQNIQALRMINLDVDTTDFEKYSKRLRNEDEIKMLSLFAESKTIRDRALSLLK
jgi:predicted aldo/keto reductase-like oxidoreductase